MALPPQDLRNSLEKERERIVALCNHLERMTNQQTTQPPTTATATHVRHLKKSDSSRPTVEELQVTLLSIMHFIASPDT